MGDMEVGPIMDGGGCVDLAISAIRLVPVGTLGHGSDAARPVRSVGHA
jgi:hypothetical protein